jgi:hypothetical protein
VTVMADGDGAARARGFCGDYDVLVSHGQASTAATARLERTGGQVTVVLSEGA